ncbi:MAG: Uma2 family endonuclease [Armatimonadota bacterium]
MAISLKLAAPPSDEEILELSERNPAYQFERTAAGELIVTPTGSAGGRRDLALSAQLDTWAEADGRGVAFGSSTGFRLPDGSLLSPDASWVRRERWEALTVEQQEDFAPLCPDAVFEILSRSDTLSDLRKKIRVYLANGAHLAVLIDPQRRAVEIYAPAREPQILDSPESVSFDPVLPGFTLTLGRIFS